MCNYRPLVMAFLATILASLAMCVFTMGMWMYIGDFFPSYRYRYTWYWSLVSYLLQGFHSIICSVMLYKQTPSKHSNGLCMIGLVIILINWIVHTSVSHPNMTKEEFREYIFDSYEREGNVPIFMDYFQYKIGCCGIDDYRDYFKFFGTKMVNGTIVFDIPRSCCYTEIIKDRDCGMNIPFRSTNEEDIADLEKRINLLNEGCYHKFNNIVFKRANYQLTALNAVFKNMPIMFIIITIVQFGIYYYYYCQTLTRIQLVLLNPDERMGDKPRESTVSKAALSKNTTSDNIAAEHIRTRLESIVAERPLVTPNRRSLAKVLRLS